MQSRPAANREIGIVTWCAMQWQTSCCPDPAERHLRMSPAPGRSQASRWWLPTTGPMVHSLAVIPVPVWPADNHPRPSTAAGSWGGTTLWCVSGHARECRHTSVAECAAHTENTCVCVFVCASSRSRMMMYPLYWLKGSLELAHCVGKLH